MRAYLLCAVALMACGSVNGPGAPDAPRQQDDGGVPDASPDASMVCTVHDTIDSCGPACTKCPAGDSRQVPVCDGTACAISCTNAAPRCTDNSCAQLVWAFDSNMLDGIAPRSPAGLALAVRNHGGNLALAIDVTNLGEVSFRIPICVTGNIQLQTKTLVATVFFEGGTDAGNQYYVQASAPAPMTGAFLGTKDLASGAFVTFSAPMSMSQFSNTATDVVFQAGTFGAQFSGTIWFDDIRIQ